MAMFPRSKKADSPASADLSVLVLEGEDLTVSDVSAARGART